MSDLVYFMGDIHGDAAPVQKLIERAPAPQYLVLLGDAGCNFFFNKKDKKFKDDLSELPITYFVVRGNHEQRPSILSQENPFNWHLERFFDELVFVENDYPNIKYAMDYVNVYNILGYKTLVIPGAYSTDKWYRLAQHWTWFPREQLTAEEMVDGLQLIKENNNQFDLVLSHTCPKKYEPTDLFSSYVDQKSVDRSMEDYMDQIEIKLNYKLWMFGHFHQTRIYPNNKVIMLSNDKVLELRRNSLRDIISTPSLMRKALL